MATRVLIVDDSPVDRRLVEFFLKKGIGDVDVANVENGKKGLDFVLSRRPDLVITDLQMPEMNGLQLVENIVAQGCDVPVILMTCVGSQEVAVKALKAGAASYVPKRCIDKSLAVTVQNILAMCHWKTSLRDRLNSLVGVEMQFGLKNDASLILPLIRYLQDVLFTMQVASSLEVIRIGIAIHESLMNAIYDGNLGLDSNLLYCDDSTFYRLADERSQDQRYKARRVRLLAQLSATESRFTISDDGDDSNRSEVVTNSDEINLDCTSNRGPLLIRSIMDEVTRSLQGHEVTMVKRTSRSLKD